MASILLVRHGQASFLKENYDQLSEIGYLQGEALGKFLVERHYTFEVAFSGTLQRHLQTYESTLKTYTSAQNILPVLQSLPIFNEHEGTKVYQVYKDKLLEQDEQLRKIIHEKGLNSPQARHGLIRNFFKAVKLWAKGEVLVEGVETFEAFAERCQEAFQLLNEEVQRHKSIIVFTSGGTIGMLIGILLGLNAEQIIELNWQTRNTGISEWRYGGERFFLHSFNEIPHLSQKLITYV